jgi:hypothetical protein
MARGRRWRGLRGADDSPSRVARFRKKREENDMNEATRARRSRRAATGFMLGIALAIAALAFPSQVLAQAGLPKELAKELATIPPNKDTDLKFYQADGAILQGSGALEHMTSDANLVLWVAGNQFFAMDEVIGAFQKAYPGVTVGLITLPPGLILSAIQAGGWTPTTAGNIDVRPTSTHRSIQDICNG